MTQCKDFSDELISACLLKPVLRDTFIKTLGGGGGGGGGEGGGTQITAQITRSAAQLHLAVQAETQSMHSDSAKQMAWGCTKQLLQHATPILSGWYICWNMTCSMSSMLHVQAHD